MQLLPAKYSSCDSAVTVEQAGAGGIAGGGTTGAGGPAFITSCPFLAASTALDTVSAT